MMRNLAQQLGPFKLSLQHILLAALADTVARIGDLLDLLQDLPVALEDLQRLLHVRNLKIGFLDLLKNGSPHGFQLVPADCSVLLRRFALELELSRIRKILRYAKSEVGEVAVAVPSKRSRTSNRE